LVITINLKKSNKKNRCLKLPAASQHGHQKLPVSSSKQNKRSQNLFQNPNLILSHGLLSTLEATPIPDSITVSTSRQHFF
jgi:hypothetical protein